MEIFEDKPGKRILLLGNEAISRGALEAGVDVITTYPGTPSSEIADTFSEIAKKFSQNRRIPGFYFEYSTNEKVALEIAAAASFSGLRSLTCMKHVGLNVASDAFMTYLYVGCKGGHIIVSADDPFCHSSQNEQDNRYYAFFAGCPMLEPTTPEEAKEMTRIGFRLSEDLQLPILLRTTTRLNHVRGAVSLKSMKKPKGKGYYKKDSRHITVPATARINHSVLLEKLKKAEKISEKSPFNEIQIVGKESNRGIITSGISFNYVKEAAEDLQLNVNILKLGMTHPIPRRMCEHFIDSCKNIVVVEELEPLLENQIKTMAYDMGSTVKIFGKSNVLLSRLHEYSPDIVIKTLSEIFKVKHSLTTPIQPKTKLPSRPPTLCPGCPHRATYYAAKKAAPKDTIYPTDIGCYTLGKNPPLEMADILLCMGSNAGMACGFAIATNQKIISFMGDSTFFHAAIPAVIDAVHHNHNCVITVLDNRTTAMTGHQPHPGTGYNGMGKKAQLIKVEEVVKGLGIKHVVVIDPNNIKEAIRAFKEALSFKGPSVIVSISPCILLENRTKKHLGKEIPVYQVDQEKCTQCKICVSRFGCPAFYIDEDETIYINEEQCNGCGICIQICPFKAVSKKKKEG